MADHSADTLSYGIGDATYQAVGGYDGLVRLVDAFYEAMSMLPQAKRIREMHPADLTRSKDKLVHFLSGWMNGPTIYAEKYGSINIPMAHAHLEIDEAERDAWLLCMEFALRQLNYPQALQNYLLHQLSRPAEWIREMSASGKEQGAADSV
ncbi:group II truncated hemoglobin [Thiomicrorhabdus sp. zzn3]|uniref:group II truncated hemoglobin n=1 Tax=Thiomicrorhabdus sp. zzn3 TaxID=3039775 RepID=UPI002436BABC|nr:group II truncated hemoglobin [Thiomicrorhabdus sp. zzn3]MDG6778720.1 group II truncated hemoglobin [Thiomicrorhabdus sp. zzn3]